MVRGATAECQRTRGNYTGRTPITMRDTPITMRHASGTAGITRLHVVARAVSFQHSRVATRPVMRAAQCERLGTKTGAPVIMPVLRAARAHRLSARCIAQEASPLQRVTR